MVAIDLLGDEADRNQLDARRKPRLGRDVEDPLIALGDHINHFNY